MTNRPFQVDDKLIMHSPHTDQDTPVIYRGPGHQIYATSVVYDPKTGWQSAVPNEWLRKASEPTVCPKCDGTGNLVIEAILLTAQGASKAPPVDIDCVWCDGKGTLTELQVREMEAWEATLCKCDRPSGQARYYETRNGSHGWLCADCGKSLQTG